MSKATYTILLRAPGGTPSFDISADVKELQIERGRDNMLSKVVAGSCQIVVSDPVKKYSPLYATSPLYPYLKPGAEIRIEATFAGFDYALFTGRLDRIIPHPILSKQEATIYALDQMEWLANSDTKISLPMQINKTPAQIIQAILNEVGGFSGPVLDTVPVETLPYFWCERASPRQALEDLMASALGMIYIKGDGTLVFESRHHRLMPPHNVSLVSLDNSMSDIFYELAAKGVKNRIVAEFIQRAAGESDVLWELGEDEILYVPTANTIPGPGGAAAALWHEVKLSAPATAVETPVASPYYKTDNFNDGALDTTYWDIVLAGAGTSVLEINNRLECTTSGYSAAGVVTKSAIPLSDHFIEVNTSFLANRGVFLLISPVKITTQIPQVALANSYFICKRSVDFVWQVVRSKDGVVTTLATGPMARTGKLGMNISGGKITFYHNGIEVFQEDYALASATCYVYLFAYGSPSTWGMDWFDDFFVAQPSDFVANSKEDGSGDVEISNLSVTLHTKWAERVLVRVLNNAGHPVYIMSMQLRGTPLESEEPKALQAEDAASRIQYGARHLTLEGKFFPSFWVAQDFVTYNLSRLKDSVGDVTISFVGRTDTLLTQALTREISDRVRVIASRLEMDHHFFIEKITTTIDAARIHRCEWVLGAVPTLSYWIVGVSALGTGTRLAY